MPLLTASGAYRGSRRGEGVLLAWSLTYLGADYAGQQRERSAGSPLWESFAPRKDRMR